MKTLALALALTTGCSAALQSRPHKAGTPAKECTIGWGYAGADLGLTAVSLGAVGFGAADYDQSYRRAMIGAGLVSAIIFAASADAGLSWRNSCERDEAQAAER
jgi:hypothetical protein